MSERLSEAALAALAAVDTPTICNALEVVAPERRGHGFTRLPVQAAFPGLKPMVGYAKTAKIRAAEPPDMPADEARAKRLAYYDYISSGPGPSVVILEDTDWPDCIGAFWGEVNSAIHKGLGLAGALTNGTMRDLGDLAEGFNLIAGSVKPSHVYVHVLDTDCPVRVFDLDIAPGDLIHADRHGAVIIPEAVAAAVPDAIELCTRKEEPVLAAARAPGFTVEKLKQAWGEADDVH